MEGLRERLSESPILGRVHPVSEAARTLEIGGVDSFRRRWKFRDVLKLRLRLVSR